MDRLDYGNNVYAESYAYLKGCLVHVDDRSESRQDLHPHEMNSVTGSIHYDGLYYSAEQVAE